MSCAQTRLHYATCSVCVLWRYGSDAFSDAPPCEFAFQSRQRNSQLALPKLANRVKEKHSPQPCSLYNPLFSPDISLSLQLSGLFSVSLSDRAIFSQSMFPPLTYRSVFHQVAREEGTHEYQNDHQQRNAELNVTNRSYSFIFLCYICFPDPSSELAVVGSTKHRV